MWNILFHFKVMALLKTHIEQPNYISFEKKFKFNVQRVRGNIKDDNIIFKATKCQFMVAFVRIKK